MRGARFAGALFDREEAVVAFPFTAVIFDMDGVLIDSEFYYWRQLRDFCDDNGIDVTDDELNAQVGASHQSFRRMLKGWFERLGSNFTVDEAEQAFYDWSADRPMRFRDLLNPGVYETITALKDAGVRVALASSSPMVNIKRVLRECDLTDAFEVIVSGEQFHESKPEPDIYLHTLDCLGLSAEECCCVEDSVPGITAGKRAGLTVIAKREERFGFSQEAADRIIDAIPDLLAIGK